MKNKHVIVAAPIMKASSFQQRSPGKLNSLIITSEQAMYRKEPAAKLVKITWTRSPLLDKAIPIPTPTGEAHEKQNTNHRTREKSSGKALTRLIPKELEAAPLWIRIAITILRV